MRNALSHEFKQAIPAYDEKPRSKWILDNSVQNTIVVSRTFFTQDVNSAFDELEEGNEDALKVGTLVSFLPYLQLQAASAPGNTCPATYSRLWCMTPSFGASLMILVRLS